MIEGDRYLSAVGTTDETITFRITVRDTEWMIDALRQALLTLDYQQNWDSDPENLDFWDERTEDYVADLLESFAILDQIGQINAYCIADYPDLPEGVLPCRGETYDKEEYPILWDRLPGALKTETTFTTPDLRGHVLGAAGTYPGLSTRTVLQRVGSETHTLTTPEMPSHSHSYTPPAFNVDLEAPGAPDPTAAGIGLPASTGSAGGDQPHNNMQPTVFLVYGITAK